ncbi:unnamed protein product [Mucor fragilis]
MTKKQLQSFALPDVRSQGSIFSAPSEAEFSFRFVTSKRAFASTGSSDSSVPAHVSQRPTFNYRRYSQQSYDSNASSILPMDMLRPSLDVDLTDYYTHLPSGWTDEQKTRQLLIWFMEREADEESSPETHVTAEARRAQLVANQLKIKIIKDMKEGRVDVSCYNRPDKMEEVEEKENPINIANAEKLEALSEANQNLCNEMDDWKKTTINVYQAHADAIDAIQVDAAILYKDVDLEFVLQHLHKDQQQFYKDYCATEDMDTVEAPDMIDPAVGKQESKLARKTHERAQYIPESRYHSRMQYLEVVLKHFLSKRFQQVSDG